MPTVTYGTTLWVTANDALLKVDALTNKVESLDAPVMRGDTFLALADEGLWATRWEGGKLYLLDPQTGDVLHETTLESAVNPQLVGDDLWVGQESKRSMFKVDRDTGAVDPAKQLDYSAYSVSGMGDLWFLEPKGDSVVTRVDPKTNQVKATIDFPAEQNCYLWGSTFPDSVWTACYWHDTVSRSVARIDPETNTVATVATVPPTMGGYVIAIGDHPWFIGTYHDADGKVFSGLVRIDPHTGKTDRFLSLPGTDPDLAVLAGNALWIPDEYGSRLMKIDLADLDTA